MRIGLATRSLQHAAGAHDEQRSQVRIAAAGDVSEALLAAGGVLTRNEPEPGRELAAVLELAHIADARDDGRGGQGADALALLSELGAVVIARVSFDRALVLLHPLIQHTQVLAQIADRARARARQAARATRRRGGAPRRLVAAARSRTPPAGRAAD